MKKCAENYNRFCPDYPKKCRFCGAFREPTNADRIRAMSDEELADVLRGFATKPMQGSFLKWLQQPAEDDHDA